MKTNNCSSKSCSTDFESLIDLSMEEMTLLVTEKHQFEHRD